MIFFLVRKELMQLANLQDLLPISRCLFVRVDVFFHWSFCSVIGMDSNILLVVDVRTITIRLRSIYKKFSFSAHLNSTLKSIFCVYRQLVYSFQIRFQDYLIKALNKYYNGTRIYGLKYSYS